MHHSSDSHVLLKDKYLRLVWSEKNLMDSRVGSTHNEYTNNTQNTDKYKMYTYHFAECTKSKRLICNSLISNPIHWTLLC